MAKKNNDIDVFKVAMVLFAAVIIGIILGVIPVGHSGSQIPDGFDTEYEQGPQLGCPDTGQTDILLAAYNDLDADDSLVKTNATYYRPGEATPVETVTTHTGGYNGTTTDPDCGETIYVIFGGYRSKGYYLFQTNEFNVGARASYKIKQAVAATGSATVTADNTSTNGVTTEIFTTLTTSEDSAGDIIIKIKEATADAYWSPFGKTVIGFDYQTSNFTSVEPISYIEQIGCGVQFAGYEKCFLVDTSVAVDYGTASIPILIDTKDSVNPQKNATKATSIGVKVDDWATYEDDGIVYEGFEDEVGNALGATAATFNVTVR